MEENKVTEREHFWQSGLSIVEAKVSMLIVILIATVIFAGVVYWQDREITSNLTTVITTLIFSIAGVNVANQVKDAIANKFPKG